MSLIVAALVSALQASSASHPVVEAFRDACIPERSGMQALSRGLEARGWRRAGPQDHPELARTSRADQALAAALANPEWRSATGEAAPLPMLYWVKGEGSGRLFLRQSISYEADEVYPEVDPDSWDESDPVAFDVTTHMECKVFDYDAATPIRPESITAWVGSQPAEVRQESDGYQFASWDVSSRLMGGLTISTFHTPAGNSLGGQVITQLSIGSIVATRRLPVRPGHY